MEIVGRPGRAFFPEEEGVPAYDELIYVAHKDSVDRPELKRFLTAVEKATHWLINHPAEAWEAFKATDQALDDELNKRAWAATLPRFSQSPAALDYGRYARFATFLEAQGLVSEPPAVRSYAVDVFAGP
jgi:putative hydroxymethylpyrimidine transport system substrate-binding protein